MLINFTQMSLCSIFGMQAISYQFKRDVAAQKGTRMSPAHAANLVANSGNALYGV